MADSRPKILLENAGFMLLLLFYLCSAISKSGTNICGGLVLLASFVYIVFYQRDIFRNNGFLLILIVPYIIGFFLTFFSMHSEKAVFCFLNQYKFTLMFIPLTVFIMDRSKLNWAYTGLVVSVLVTVIFGLLIYAVEARHGLKHAFVIGRLADLLIVVMSLNIILLFKQELSSKPKTFLFKALNAFLFIIFLVCMVLTKVRGAWVGLAAAIVVFAFFYKRSLLILFLAGILFVFAVPANNTYKKEFKSIFDFTYTKKNTEGKKRTTATFSRLHMWKTGYDFAKEHLLFGTGTEHAGEAFKEYFYSKPETYQEQYCLALRNPGNFHNSYLQIFVESGLIFFILYIGSLLWIIIWIIRHAWKKENRDNIYLITPIIASVGFLIPQLFHGELYSYSVNAYYLTLFGACFTIKSLDAGY